MDGKLTNMHAILYTDGEIHLGELKRECQNEKWVPVLTYSKGEQITLVCFDDLEIAYNFVKRNINKKWVKGAITLIPENLEWIKNKGWNIEMLDYPKKYVDRKDIQLGFQILELLHKPDMLIRCT